jgi:hypothetical protein
MCFCEFAKAPARRLRHEREKNQSNLRNSSGVSPALLAIEPLVIALMGLWRGMMSRS